MQRVRTALLALHIVTSFLLTLLNPALVLLVLPALAFMARQRWISSRDPERISKPVPTSERRGPTLVMALVLVLVVTVLAAIVTPVFLHQRRRSVVEIPASYFGRAVLADDEWTLTEGLRLRQPLAKSERSPDASRVALAEDLGGTGWDVIGQTVAGEPILERERVIPVAGSSWHRPITSMELSISLPEVDDLDSFEVDPAVALSARSSSVVFALVVRFKLGEQNRKVRK